MKRLPIAQAHLPTEFWDFVIHVYPGDQWKETVVFTTKNLDVTKPVLVRVHSECLTGDIFWSYKCDCGPQKEASLRMINMSENGMFIYHRQEWRGIGLYEKIKAYKLQEEWYDTYDANVALGHKPDAREYSVVWQIFRDFWVREIRLITNNPAKISEISALWVTITERVPLIMATNTHNEAYIDTKANKFQHLFSDDSSHYFYWVHGVESQDQANELCRFVSYKIRNPLLKICISHETLNAGAIRNQIIQKRTEEIFQTISAYERCTPILHFSFSESTDPYSDIKYIKDHFPYVKFVQLNDLPLNIWKEITRFASEFFVLDLPITNESFHLYMMDDNFIDFIKHQKIFILLDNSWWKWIRESTENYMKKISFLLKKWLNNIVLAWWFWPEHLSPYFECKEAFKMNFSIDAETHLKTDGHFDAEKAKLYLTYLLKHG